MLINKLYLSNFRNLKDGEISFAPGLNVLVGRNAQGKTNIIEALHLLGRGRSFRRAKVAELIRWGEVEAGVGAEGKVGQEKIELKVRLESAGAKLYPEGTKHHFGKIPLFFVGEEDIEIVRGADTLRRRFLDRVAMDNDGKHWHYLTQYYKVLRHRNNILKDPAAKVPDQLLEWNSQLIKYGEQVAQGRAKVAEGINRLLAAIHNTGRRDEKVSLQYRPTGFAMESLLTRERERGTTLQGPHLDGVDLLINGKDARTFASYGQKRNLALSLKLAQITLYREQSGKAPLLLLDDVFLGLDGERYDVVAAQVFSAPQAIFASSSIDDLRWLPHRPNRVWQVEAGETKHYDHTN